MVAAEAGWLRLVALKLFNSYLSFGTDPENRAFRRLWEYRDRGILAPKNNGVYWGVSGMKSGAYYLVAHAAIRMGPIACRTGLAISRRISRGRNHVPAACLPCGRPAAALRLGTDTLPPA